ncbi:uncharacterized protein [Watersipora subatra]|uniref:uncharacterized protein n=1 Tax=Watersipora subatra TaxID=2589382 RepID=UPI00355B070F
MKSALSFMILSFAFVAGYPTNQRPQPPNRDVHSPDPIPTQPIVYMNPVNMPYSSSTYSPMTTQPIPYVNPIDIPASQPSNRRGGPAGNRRQIAVPFSITAPARNRHNFRIGPVNMVFGQHFSATNLPLTRARPNLQSQHPSASNRPSNRPWWYGRTSLGRPVIGVTDDGRPITEPRKLPGNRHSIFSAAGSRARGNTKGHAMESFSSGDSISFEDARRNGNIGHSDFSSFSRSSESWESMSDELHHNRRRVRFFTDRFGRQMIELLPSSESDSSGDSISYEDTLFEPNGSYSASSGSESSSAERDFAG